jgi:hypothetical protein
MTVMSKGHILRDSISSLYTYIHTCAHAHKQTHTHTQLLSFQSPSFPGMQDVSHKKMVG